MLRQLYNVTKIRRDGQAKVNNLLITCVDYRIQRGIDLFTITDDKLRSELFDRFSYPGGSLQFEINQQMMINNIGLFKTLHGVNHVVCIDHADCGACQAYLRQTCPEYSDMSLEEKTAFEKSTQVTALLRANEVIKKYYPEMGTQLMYYDDSGAIS
jgi:hypothetical protein